VKRNVWIVRNPYAGSRSTNRRVSRLSELLRAEGFHVTFRQGQTAQHARHLVRSVPENTYALIAVGGDGTTTNVLRAIQGKSVGLYVLPAGTENVLAREFGHTPRPRCIVDALLAGRRRPIDLAEANGHIFAALVGIGFDAEVLMHLNTTRKGHINKLHYVRPILRTVMMHRFPRLTIEVDGEIVTQNAGMVFICNARHYAMFIRLAPRAAIDDGLLDVVCFQGRSFWHLVKHATDTLFYKHLGRGDVAFRRGRRIRVTADRRVPWQLDGDLGGTLPVDVRVHPAAAQVFLPADGRHAARPRAANTAKE